MSIRHTIQGIQMLKQHEYALEFKNRIFVNFTLTLPFSSSIALTSLDK